MLTIVVKIQTNNDKLYMKVPFVIIRLFLLDAYIRQEARVHMEFL